ncbi:unnamed protein product, partial [Lymnaea stagnalis]
MGTAAKINLNFDLRHPVNPPSSLAPPLAPQSTTSDKPAGTGLERDKDKHLYVDIGLANQAQMKACWESQEEPQPKCSMCHIPYNPASLPFEIQLSKCAICKKKNVPEVLFTTIDPP